MSDTLEQLPPNYKYHFVPDDKYLCFRIKEVTDKASSKEWVKAYSRESKTTWRIMRTYPASGMFNLYKVDYRCCHNTDRRVKGTGPSKHTGCQARLDITIKRYRETMKVPKAERKLIQSHPCMVKLLRNHNHPVHTAEALKHRDLDPKVKDKIRNLFRQGYNPATALKLHKSDLMQEKGSEYSKFEKDGMVMPTYSVVHKLFQKEFFSDPPVNPPDETNDSICHSPPDLSAPDHSPPQSPAPEEIPGRNELQEKLAVISQLQSLFKKIEEKVDLNPEVFLPAAKAMLYNVEKFTSTDTGLVRAMCTFGNFRCAKRSARKKGVRKRKKKVVGQRSPTIATRSPGIATRSPLLARSPAIASKNKSFMPCGNPQPLQTFNNNDLASCALSGQPTNVGRVNSIPNPIQNPIQNTIQNPIQNAIQNAIQNPIQNTIQNPIQNPTQYPTQYPTKYPTQWVGYFN